MLTTSFPLPLTAAEARTLIYPMILLLPFPEKQMEQRRRQTDWHGDREEDPAAGPEYQEAQAATEHAGSGAREKARAPEEENSFLQGKIPPRR